MLWTRLESADIVVAVLISIQQSEPRSGPRCSEAFSWDWPCSVSDRLAYSATVHYRSYRRQNGSLNGKMTIRFNLHTQFFLSVLCRCWLVGRKGIRFVKKTEWWDAGVVICLERGANLHMVQLMPLPLTVSCFSKIQIGLPFWYRPTWVVPVKGLLNGCVCYRHNFITVHIRILLID